MTRAAVYALMAISLSGSIGIGCAQDVRVDLFTKSGLKEVLITPGMAAVEFCPARSSCATASPGEGIRCATAAGKVQCRGSAHFRPFVQSLATSTSVFRLEVTPRRNRAETSCHFVIARSARISSVDGNLRVVAEIDLETYVTGVLAGEAATFKSPAAMDAMTIVARTWALASRGRHGAEGYDFCSLTHCQFFRPPIAADAGKAASDAAARTAGLVLKFQGKLIDAYYSAYCGGRTATAASVWPDSGRP